MVVGCEKIGDAGAEALSRSLEVAGIETVYVGRPGGATEIAALANDLRADSVELCLPHGGGITVLRDLLRELRRLGRPEVGIVVHRVQ